MKPWPQPGVSARIVDCKYEGAELLDVAYTHQFEGTFNVTRALRAIEAGSVRFQRALCPIIPSVIAANAAADVCPEVLAGLNARKAHRPVLLIMCADGTGFCADGNNRLRWLIEHGFTEFKAHIIGYAEREQFRVKTLVRLEGEEEWRIADETELLRMMMGKHDLRSKTPKGARG